MKSKAVLLLNHFFCCSIVCGDLVLGLALFYNQLCPF